MSGKKYRKNRARIKKQIMKQTLRIKRSLNGLIGQVYITEIAAVLELPKVISFKFCLEAKESLSFRSERASLKLFFLCSILARL